VRRETSAANRSLGKLVLYLILPGLFLLIPTAWLERHPAPCLYRMFLKRRCPGCGMTRALSAALHGHIKRAWGQNKLVTVVLPLGILAWLKGLTASYREWRLAMAERENQAGAATQRAPALAQADR
jgi:hypothetical protein